MLSLNWQMVQSLSFNRTHSLAPNVCDTPGSALEVAPVDMSLAYPHSKLQGKLPVPHFIRKCVMDPMLHVTEEAPEFVLRVLHVYGECSWDMAKDMTSWKHLARVEVLTQGRSVCSGE